jgi:hypothetical protein
MEMDPFYWMIDADARSAEVWTQDAVLPRPECACLVWQPLGASSPFTLSFQELLRPL